MTQPKDDENQNRRYSDNHDAMLARIDERTENLSKQLENVWKEVREATAKMSAEIQATAEAAATSIRDSATALGKAVKESSDAATAALKDSNDKAAQLFVSKDEFGPVKMITYGLVGVVCLTVLVAMLAYVVHVPQETHFEVSADRVSQISVDHNNAHTTEHK